MPAFVRGFQAAAGDQIAGHDIGSAHIELAAAGDALHRLQAHLNAGQQPADRAATIVVGLVDGNHRRGLCGAISLENRHRAKALGDQVVGFVPHLLRPADDELQAGELIGLGRAGVLVHEGVGGQQHRGAGVLDQRRDLLDVQRRGILEGLQAAQNGQQDSGRQPKAVERRQGIEEHPGRIEIDVGLDLVDIGDQVRLAQHHAPRCAETAGGKQNDARLIGPGGGAKAFGQGAGGCREESVRQADTGADIFQVGDGRDCFQGIDQVVQLSLFDEPV